MDRQSIESTLGENITSPEIAPPSVSGRSNQSTQMICRTESHIVESLGASLPNLVTEALAFRRDDEAISVNASQDGWAWLVHRGRLLVWQCEITRRDPEQRTAFNGQCRELLLLQTDLAHRAECIAVWLAPGQEVPSCIAVSPEGIVRYWASIAHDGPSVEMSAELAGGVAVCLTYVPRHGCILATTTGTVVLLQPQFVAGRNEISSRVLGTSGGCLGEISQRMSSAMSQSPVMKTKLVKVTCSSLGERDTRVLVFAGSSLQYWSFPPGEQEKMEFEEDLGNLVSQAFQRRFWESSACNPNNMDIWLIDMQASTKGMVLLMAACCVDVSPQIHFAMGHISLSKTTTTNSFNWFTPVKIGPLMREMHQDDVESIILSYRLIFPSREAIIYNHQNVIVINGRQEFDQDKIDIMRGVEDRILGGAVCFDTCVLFTRNLALITIMRNFLSAHHVDAKSEKTGLTVSLIDEKVRTVLRMDDESRKNYVDNNGYFIVALLMSLRSYATMRDDLVLHFFPLQEEPLMDIDISSDTLILKAAENLIDDYPANDPRWTNREFLAVTVNAVTSVQIPHQLEGKKQTLELFISFSKHKLRNRLRAVTHQGIIKSTSHVLNEYAEKIVAALTIYNLQNRHAEILDSIIEQTVTSDRYITDDLTASDVFYRQVSKIQLLLHTLVNSASEMTQSEQSTQQVSQYILRVNSILLGVLHEVVKYRQQNAERYVPTRYWSGMIEYLPWTAATGTHGLRDCLNTMRNLTLQHGITGTSDSTLKHDLNEQVVGLIDLILDGEKCHLESVRGTEKFEMLLNQYEAERSNLIQSLIENEQYENAAMMAEKYCDFASLVQICELTDNNTRLNNYTERVSSQDFAGFLFHWYVTNGRQGNWWNAAGVPIPQN